MSGRPTHFLLIEMMSTTTDLKISSPTLYTILMGVITLGAYNVVLREENYKKLEEQIKNNERINATKQYTFSTTVNVK